MRLFQVMKTLSLLLFIVLPQVVFGKECFLSSDMLSREQKNTCARLETAFGCTVDAYDTTVFKNAEVSLFFLWDKDNSHVYRLSGVNEDANIPEAVKGNAHLGDKRLHLQFGILGDDLSSFFLISRSELTYTGSVANILHMGRCAMLPAEKAIKTFLEKNRKDISERKF